MTRRHREIIHFYDGNTFPTNQRRELGTKWRSDNECNIQVHLTGKLEYRGKVRGFFCFFVVLPVIEFKKWNFRIFRIGLQRRVKYLQPFCLFVFVSFRFNLDG